MIIKRKIDNRKEFFIMPIKNIRAASHIGFSGDYDLSPFWVVTKPTSESKLADIFFESDLFGFILQEKGGLKIREIVGIYTDHAEAKKIAQRLLANKKKWHRLGHIN